MCPASIHNRLVSFVHKELVKNGYTVQEEYPVDIDGKKYRIDVVGFKGDESIAVECRNTQLSKLDHLADVFTEVVHLTTDDYIDFLEGKIDELTKENMEPKILKKLNLNNAPKKPEITHSKNISIVHFFESGKRGSKKTKGTIIRRYRFVPYEELAEVVKNDGTAFLEQLPDRPLKPQTMWKAAKKLSQMIGQKVFAYPALYKNEVDGKVKYFEGYSFQTDGKNE